MNYRFFYLILLLTAGHFSLGQILPEPGAKLNYTQIMFEHPQVAGADQYLLEVTQDENDYSFTKPLVKQKDSSTATMTGNFEFGKKYVWRYTGLYKGKVLGWKGPYNFETLNNPAVDKKLFRVRVLQNDSTANGGGLIILDVSGNIVDRHGKFVWFYAGTNANAGNHSNPLDQRNSDLRVTPFGTMTAIYDRKAQERDLSGNILWQAPMRISGSTDSLNSTSPYAYNHCFKRLTNGNYMVIDQEHISKPDSILGKRGNVPYNLVTQTETGSVVVADEIIEEFDRSGNLVWKWSSENYFDTAELRRMVQSKPDPGLLHPEPGGHINAFEVDEKSGFVYAGFRNVSRVIKIDKKSGWVVCAWGDNMSYRGDKNGDGFFLKQHGLALLRDGSIAVFNNNFNLASADKELPSSSVVIFTEPTYHRNSQLTWKFDCRFDSANNVSGTSGNVDELKNGNLLVCMGAVNRVFEITRNKRIVWSALIEKKYGGNDTAWQKFSLYRAHFTSSLYPCYFTIQTNSDTLNGLRTTFQVKAFNDGTEDDSYMVDISSSSGYYKKQFTTAVIKSRKSITFEITPDRLPATNDKIEVSVTSKTNPDFKRTVYVQYNK